jgi:1-acyl-sn-glycerol-3-phosphate acyltransferase
MTRALLGIWTWLAFAVVSILGFIVCSVIFVVTVPFDSNRLWIGRGIRITGILMVKSVPAWRFSFEGPKDFRPPTRSVCVSNHVSNLDPFLLAHSPWEMKFLAKSTLFRIPVVGWGIGLAGDIPLVRGSTTSVKRAMQRAARYVAAGMPVLIFPEGTRSETDSMLPFKDGAFRLAIEQKAFVVPLAVGGTTKALRKGDWKPGAARGVVLAGTPIDTQGMSLSDVPRLKEQARAQIEELRHRIRTEILKEARA